MIQPQYVFPGIWKWNWSQRGCCRKNILANALVGSRLSQFSIVCMEDAKSGETAVKALRSATQSGNRKLNLHLLERGAEAWVFWFLLHFFTTAWLVVSVCLQTNQQLSCKLQATVAIYQRPKQSQQGFSCSILLCGLFHFAITQQETLAISGCLMVAKLSLVLCKKRLCSIDPTASHFQIGKKVQVKCLVIAQLQIFWK